MAETELINEHNPEISERALGYDQYRTICDDMSTAYRPIGLLANEQYQIALQDRNTEFIEHEGRLFPALVSLDLAVGYDIARIRQLTESDQVYLMVAPIEMMQGRVLSVPDSSVVLVESDHEHDTTNREIAEDVINIGGRKANVYDFIDERIEDDHYQRASMSLYQGLALPVAEQTTRIKNIDEVFQELYGDEIPHDGLALINTAQLQSNPQLAEEIWDLFKDRFQWLGDYHPVWMEDDRVVFDSIIFSDQTYIPTRFIDGEVVAAGIVMHGMNEVDWIKSQVFQATTKEDESDTTQMYFFGVAAQESKKSLHNMEAVVHFHCHLAQQAGIKYRVFFESTNMSSQYIPQGTEAYIDSSGTMKLKDGINKIRQIDYWYVK